MLTEPKRDRRAERHEATKAEVLAAAWDLCRSEGLAALSLRDLARRVGMQAPSLYSYFASKNDIYDAMYVQGNQQYVESQPDLRDVHDAREGLRLTVRHFVEFCTADPARYQLLYQRTIPGFEPSPESFAISVGAMREFAAWMEAVRLDPSSMDLLTAIFTGLTDQQISNDPGGDRWIRLLDDAVDMFLAYVDSHKKPTKGKRPR